PAFHKVKLHAVEEMLSSRDQEEQSQKSLARFLQVRPSVPRALPLPSIVLNAPSDANECLAKISAHRQVMSDLLPKYKTAAPGYKKSAQTMQAAAVLQLPAKVDLAEMDLPKLKKEAAPAAKKKAEQDQQAHVAEMSPFEQAAGERLCAALNFLQSPEIA